MSPRSVRALEAAGTLHRVEIPDLRKVVFDRLQLDRLVDAWGGRASAEIAWPQMGRPRE